MCPWAATRPLAVRAASFARRVVSKPGQAPPPPTGTAAWPSMMLHVALGSTDLPGALHTCGAWPLCVPVGGGPPARSPHASLRLGVIDLEARPGPAATHRHRDQALQ